MSFTKIAAAGIGSTETVTLHSLEVLNNATVGGVLTYEDVTNVDSIGIITARAGVLVGSGITLSKDGDIFATGVTTATKFVGDGSGLTGVASTENIRTNTNATFLQNINVSGTSTVGGDVNIADKIVHIGDTNTSIRFPAADTITAETAGSEAIRIFSDGDVGIGTATMISDSKIHINDSSTSDYRPIVIDSSATNGSASEYRQLGTTVIRIGSGGGNNLSGSNVTHGLIRTEVATIFAVGNSEKVRIASTGELLVNTTTTSPHIRLNQKLGIAYVGSYGGASLTNYGGTTAANKPLLDFNRTRGTSNGSMTAVAAGDGLGHIVFRGADGTNFIDGAGIRADVDDYNSASPGTTDLPGRLVFETTPDGSTTLTERLRITHTGALQIKSPSAIYPGAQPGEIQWWNENRAGVMAKISVNREAGTYAPAGLDFFVNENVDTAANDSQGDITARMRINSKGHTAIITNADAATASHGYSNRGGALYVKNGQNSGTAGGGAVLAENTYANHSYGACIQLYIASTNQDRAGILFSSANSTSGNKDWMIGNLNSSDDFRINYGSGRYATSWGSTFLRIDTSGTFHGSSSNNISDIRIKENIVTIQDPIEKIKNLRGVTFEWQRRTKFKEGVNYGFIAQEVNEVVPELVNKEEGLCGFDENGDIVPIVHDEGSEKRKHVDVSWGVTTDGIVSILVEAVKKLSAKNDALEARITALEE